MTLRMSHPRAKPRWLALGVAGAALMIMTAGLAFGAVFGAPADSPYVFALDGDALDPVLPDGDEARNLPDDWETIFPTAELPKGWLDRSFVDDHAAMDDTYFTGGSTKDDIDIDTVAGEPGSGGWLRDTTSSAQAKADIIDAFAASYQVNGKTIVYFGMDRFSNDGATFAGFWFLQNAISFGPTANNGVGEIHGSHVPGDILVITDFTQGGAVEKLNVYEWVGPDSGLPNVINGVFVLKFAGTDCSIANTTDLACTIVSKGESDAPWDFVPKSNVGPAGKFQAGLLVEGGINISDLFPGEDPCFTNFVAETRASFSIDSTLSDFTHGSFNTCGGIEALKYHDRNADGSRDPDGVDDTAGNADDESPLQVWTIFVDENANEILDGTEQSGVTGPDGKVTFSDLTSGAYSVCEKISDQTGWVNSDPAGTTLCKTVNVGIGGAVQSVVFGNYQNATKSGVKFNDSDGDGARDAGEPGLNGWEIHLFGTDGGGNAVHLHSTTANVSGVDGVYSFSIPPGNYTVCETQQTGWTQSYPTSTTTGSIACPAHAAGGGTPAGAGAASGRGWSISLSSGATDTNNDFGNFQNATKSGVKWHDVDGNGSRDADGADNILGGAGAADDEILLLGWEIHLFGTDGTGNSVHQHATTSANGAYSFSVPPGSYTVCETQQTTWAQTYPTSGTSGTVDCVHAAGGGGVGAGSGRGWAITLTSGQVDSGNDFGNRRLFRLIVLTCSEATGQLITSTVDLDGNPATTGDIKDTTIVNPADVTGNLCTIGGAQYPNLPAQTYTPSVVIPKP